tara:strand:+ start:2806 stop:3456 length:651 start_codon:yes stop_codon:yes gene_type:complete
MKIKIPVPESLSEMTLEQYQKFEKINTEENQGSNFLLEKMVEIFCNLPLKDIATVKFTYVQKIIKELNKTFMSKTPLINTFVMDGVEYGFIPKLDDITLGEYIDIDNNIKDWQNMHKAMSVLYRPTKLKRGERYQIEDYTAEENPELMKQMPLDVAMGSLVFFYLLQKELLETTLNYLTKEMEDSLTSEQRQILEKSMDGINLSGNWLREMLPSLT